MKAERTRVTVESGEQYIIIGRVFANFIINSNLA